MESSVELKSLHTGTCPFGCVCVILVDPSKWYNVAFILAFALALQTLTIGRDASYFYGNVWTLTKWGVFRESDKDKENLGERMWKRLKTFNWIFQWHLLSQGDVAVTILDYDVGVPGENSSSAMAADWVALGWSHILSLATSQDCCEGKMGERKLRLLD